jgi:hypothetical protein
MTVALKNFNRDADRQDPERAAQLFEVLWPVPAVHQECADRLARSICHAHEEADASWEVTMVADYIRLNVGQVEVLTLSSDEIRVLFCGPLKTSIPDRFRIEFDPAKPVYRAARVASGVCRIAPADLASVPEAIWNAHESFIAAAAKAKRVSPFKRCFSNGALRHVEVLLPRLLPRPSYFTEPDDGRKALDWRSEVGSWVRSGAIPADDLTDSIVRFFERAFENTHAPDQAWFGVHRSCVSLVVGGIFLAAVWRTGKDRGPWLLVDQDPPPIEGVNYHPVGATKRSRFPLVWAHSSSHIVIRNIVADHTIWDSFARASERILHAGIAGRRDSVQKRRSKTLLTELLGTNSGTTPERPPIPAVHRPQVPAGAGFGDSEQNRKVEEAAVHFVRKWYEKRRWQVTSVEAQRCGFDLLCTRNSEEHHVEVKGSTGSERRFIVTAGELRQVCNDGCFQLMLVTDALSEQPHSQRWSAQKFRDNFDFEPSRYWATLKEEKVTPSPNKRLQRTQGAKRADVQ